MNFSRFIKIIKKNWKDDIGFKYGECESPDFVSVTCDFEEQHICGYESDEKADFNWARNKGNTLTAQTGPSFDVIWPLLNFKNFKKINNSNVLMN